MIEFHLGDKVLVKTGFWKGKTGYITHISEADECSSNKNKYEVWFEERVEERGRIFHASALEKINLTDDERKLLFFESYLSKETLFEEMSSVTKDKNDGIIIAVYNETKHPNIAYFKVYNSAKYSSAKKVARLHFKDGGAEHHTDPDGREDWILNAKMLVK